MNYRIFLYFRKLIWFFSYIVPCWVILTNPIDNCVFSSFHGTQTATNLLGRFPYYLCKVTTYGSIPTRIRWISIIRLFTVPKISCIRSIWRYFLSIDCYHIDIFSHSFAKLRGRMSKYILFCDCIYPILCLFLYLGIPDKGREPILRTNTIMDFENGLPLRLSDSKTTWNNRNQENKNEDSFFHIYRKKYYILVTTFI